MRAFLVIIALGFSLAIMISLPAGILANQQSTQTVTADYNNAVSQIEQQLTLITVTNSSSSNSNSSFPYGGSPRYFNGGFNGQGNYMDESVADTIESIQSVVAVVPILEVPEGSIPETFTSRYGNPITFDVPAYTIEGVPLNSSLITDNYVPLPTNITDGRNLQYADSDVAVLSLNNTEYFGVGVGGEVNVNGTNFQVVGIHGESGSSSYMVGQASDVRTLYMNITDAQTVSGLTGEISQVNVYADSTADVSNVASEISSQISNLFGPTFSVNTEQDILQRTENVYNSTLAADESAISSTQTVAFEEIVVAVAATSLIVLFVMLYTVRERTKEIGTMKAIGFSNWNVMSQFMLEGILLSFVAGIVGIAIASVGTPMLSGLLLPHVPNPFSSSGTGFTGGRFGGSPPSGATRAGISAAVSTAVPNPQLMLVVLGAAVVLGLVGSLYPAWRASRTRPAEAMRYE